MFEILSDKLSKVFHRLSNKAKLSKKDIIDETMIEKLASTKIRVGIKVNNRRI